MTPIINVLLLEPGTRVRLIDGSLAEVVENCGDGMWVSVRYILSPADRSREGTEEMVFAADVVETLRG